jgi:WD40 repeat protein
LGCPVGTVESWLTRARARLRKGLKRRGLTPAPGLLAAMVPQQEWFPQATAAARAALAACRGADGAVSASAAALASDLVRDLGFAGFRRTVMVLILLAGAATGLVAGMRFHVRHPQPPEAPPAARLDEPRRDETPPADPVRPVAPVKLATLRGEDNSNGLNAVALSGDGKTVASGDNGGQVYLWDVQTGNRRVALWQTAEARLPESQRHAHDWHVHALAFSPDGKTLASGSTDRTVKLWDVAAAKEKATLRGHTVFVYTVAFSPDGRTLATAGGVQPAAVDTTIREDFRDIPKDPRMFQEVGELKVWDVATGAELLCFRGAGRVTSVAFSPNGMTLAFGGRDGTIRLWDVSSGEECAHLQEDAQPVAAVAFAPDGRTLAAVQEGVAKLWDLDSGRVRVRCKGESGGIVAVAFCADGRTLATAGNVPRDNPRNSQDVLGEVRLWDAATGRLLGTPLALGHSTSSGALAVRGTVLAVGGNRSTDRTEVTLWDLGAPGARK